MKYNLSNIMRKAHSYRAELGMSSALKRAWAEEKLDKAESALFLLKMADNPWPWERDEMRRLEREISALKGIRPLVFDADAWQAARAANVRPLDDSPAPIATVTDDLRINARIWRCYHAA